MNNTQVNPVKQVFFIKKESQLMKKRRKTKEKDEEEEEKMRKLKKTFPHFDKNELSIYFEKTSKSLSFNKERSLNTEYLKKGKWTLEEDETIKRYVLQNGEGKWNKIKIEGRNVKQIRERYVNYIKNNSQKEWNLEKENELIRMFLLYNSRWVKISSLMESTENEVKNKFYSLLRKVANSYFNGIKVKNEYVNKKLSKKEVLLKEIYIKNGDGFSNFGENDKDLVKNKKKRQFLSKSELLKYLPFLCEMRKIEYETKDTNETKQNNTDFISKDSIVSIESKDITSNSSFFSKNEEESNKKTNFLNEKFIFFEFDDISTLKKNEESSEKRILTLKKVVNLINNKKIELQKQDKLNQMKFNILYTNQIDLLNEVIIRVKRQNLMRVFLKFLNLMK